MAFLLVFFAWPVGAMLWRGASAEGVLDLGAFAEVLGREGGFEGIHEYLSPKYTMTPAP